MPTDFTIIISNNDLPALINQLTSILEVEENSIINVSISLTASYTTPDILITLSAFFRNLKLRKIDVHGTIFPNPNNEGYLSRINFYDSLGIKFQEKYPRKSSQGKFLEITNFNVKDDFRIVDQIILILKRQSVLDTDTMSVLSFCLGEILGNICIHSETPNGGWAVCQHFPNQRKILLTICDTGIGIHKALTISPLYSEWSEEEAISQCINEKVTNGKGKGYGLFATSNFARTNQGNLTIYSGNHFLKVTNSNTSVHRMNFWQGTIVNLEINTNIAVDVNSVTPNYSDYRTDYLERYEDAIIDNLWD